VSVADLLALTAGTIGFALGWLSKTAQDDEADTRLFLHAVDLLEGRR
jgi:hypothetical protein